MKIAIIGAGFTGLAAAYSLSKNGHRIVVFEKDSNPGGLAIGYQEKGWDWTLEAFYHHWFTNDHAVLNLAKELNYPVIIKRPKTSHLIDGKIYHLDSPHTLLKFNKLSIPERMQMGLVIGMLRYNPFWKPLEKITAAGFLSKTIGVRAYKELWEPLLIGKFGKYADEVSLAWFWARISKRTTNLAYPEGGFLKFAKRLEETIKEKGGKILYNTEITELTSSNHPKINYKMFGNWKLKIENYDAVVVTLPSFAFLKIAPELPDSYKKELTRMKGLGAIALVMRLNKQFLTDNTYWLSICNTQAPILAVVEHTNLMDAKHYNNEHLIYLGNYLPKDHKYFSMNAEELLKEFDPFLKTINPGYRKSVIGFKKFTAPFAQPIVFRNYSKMIPSMKTPLKNVYLANIEQVYPWDRGTNYSVELGQKAAEIISV